MALASGDVVAGADAGPGAEMGRVGAVLRRRRADLGQQGTGVGPVDARDGLEQVQLGLSGGNRRGDSTVLVGDERAGVVTGLQMAAQLAQQLGVQRGGERLGQRLELASQVAGQAGEDRVRGLLRHQAIEDASPVETEDVSD